MKVLDFCKWKETRSREQERRRQIRKAVRRAMRIGDRLLAMSDDEIVKPQGRRLAKRFDGLIGELSLP